MMPTPETKVLKVECISRLAQWRIDNFGPCNYLKSDAFKVGIWNWYYYSPSPVLWFLSFSKFYVVSWVWVVLFCWVIIRHFSIEKNRYLYIRLFPEQSRLTKEQPPFARFVLRITSSAFGRQPCVSPGMLLLLFHYTPFLTFASSQTLFDFLPLIASICVITCRN